MIIILVIISKIIRFISKFLNFGSGSTWPGHIALKFFPQILQYYSEQVTQGTIIIAGTNGKTTTAKMITDVLCKTGFKVIHNQQGANLLNGLVSSFLLKSNIQGKINADYAIFEVDENTLPEVLSRINPKIVILLNLFRDQLDRYGEVDIISSSWEKSLQKISPSAICILNADDPQIGSMGKDLRLKTFYFGLDKELMTTKELEHAVDSHFCPRCSYRLTYNNISFSHLGDWFCPKCGIKRPLPDLSEINYLPLAGLYNIYNTLAAVLALQKLFIKEEEIRDNLINFQPAFGRQEKIIKMGKEIYLYLSKNPAGFNQSLETVLGEPDKKILILSLNDQIPDGRDISWIWDVDFELLENFPDEIIVTGERVYDLALRLKYALIPENKLKVEPDLVKAINLALTQVRVNTIYILATYSSMLLIRKILSGKKLIN